MSSSTGWIQPGDDHQNNVGFFINDSNETEFTPDFHNLPVYYEAIGWDEYIRAIDEHVNLSGFPDWSGKSRGEACILEWGD